VIVTRPKTKAGIKTLPLLPVNRPSESIGGSSSPSACRARGTSCSRRRRAPARTAQRSEQGHRERGEEGWCARRRPPRSPSCGARSRLRARRHRLRRLLLSPVGLPEAEDDRAAEGHRRPACRLREAIIASENPEQAKEFLRLLVRDIQVHERRRIIPAYRIPAAVRAIPRPGGRYWARTSDPQLVESAETFDTRHLWWTDTWAAFDSFVCYLCVGEAQSGLLIGQRLEIVS
jgi:hypothetical protein